MRSIFTSMYNFKKQFNIDEWILLNPRSACISVVTTERERFTLNKNWEDSIQLKFEDTDRIEHPNVFTKEQANQIIEFIENNKELDYIIVHCFAGESRSAAISLFIEEYYNGLKIEDIRRTKFSNHNRLVFSTLLKEYIKRIV